MDSIAVAMDYYGGFAEWAQHGREMAGAGNIARQWAAEIESAEATCRKCGGPMRPGKALEQTVTTGSPDFPGDARGMTVSAGGPGRMVACLKCGACGHSIVAAQT